MKPVLRPPVLPADDSAWIWPAACGETPNQYIEFCHEFSSREEGDTTLLVAADARYAAWLNGVLIGQGPFPDWPQTRSVDAWDIGPHLRPGTNILRVLLHWIGENTASYVRGEPGVAYAVLTGDQLLAASGSGGEWRRSPCYQDKSLPRITPQLGFCFAYDVAGENATDAPTSAWHSVQSADCRSLEATGRRFRPRPLPPCELGSRIQARVVAQGLFRRAEENPEKPLASRMQHDWLSSRPINEIFDTTSPSPAMLGRGELTVRPDAVVSADGLYWVADLGREATGYLELEVTTDEPVLLEIAYGEHLDDLRVRSQVGSRYFAMSYRCRRGHQVFMEPITRLGGRYLQVHASGIGRGFKLHHFTLRESAYPVKAHGRFVSSDAMERQIHNVSVKTLRRCMADHYEDTPWREQALYANDLLNQSLGGYYVFGDYRYPQVSLDLLGEGLREDGFLELCAPARLPITIPAFTFAWIIALEKNLLFSGDLLFIQSQIERVRTIINRALSRIRTGLLPCPTGPGYWHFYDWTDGALDGTTEDDATRFARLQTIRFDAPLNAFLILALTAGARLAAAVQVHSDAQAWHKAADDLRAAFHQRFWNSVSGAYLTTTDTTAAERFPPSELVQALALCAQCPPASTGEWLRGRLLNPNDGLLPATLSQSLYSFEAMAQDPALIPPMLDRITKTWGTMIGRGATTFWETLDGGWAFDRAGSLCHGWSAIPAYLYGAYVLGVRPLDPGFASFRAGPGVRTNVSGTVPTPQGNIEVVWQPADDTREHAGRLHLPATMQATIHLGNGVVRHSTALRDGWLTIA